MRRFLVLPALLAACALAPATATAAPLTPKSAAGFRDSVGVNTHVNYFDTAYGDWNRIVQRLDELGVDHLRDNAFGNPAPNWRDWNERYFQAVQLAAAHGHRFTMVMGQPNYNGGTVDDLATALTGRLRGAVEALESPNEYDLFSGNPSWQAPLRDYIGQLRARISADPALKDLPLIGPSLVYGGSRGTLGSVDGLVDFNNIHPYAGGRPPSQEHLAREIASMAPVAGSRPMVATEVGFHNALNATSGQPPVPEDVAAAYTLRTLLEHYKAGIQRSFLYELIDEKPDPGLTDPEQNFGLLRRDFSPKPAFEALRNLLQLLGRPGDAGALTPVDVTLSGNTAGVQQLLLQDPGGRYRLVLWQSASLWDVNARVRTPVAAKRVDVQIPATSARVARPVASAAAEPLSGSGRFSVDVPADPIVIEFALDGAAPAAPAVPVKKAPGQAPRPSAPVVPKPAVPAVPSKKKPTTRARSSSTPRAFAARHCRRSRSHRAHSRAKHGRCRPAVRRQRRR